MNEVAGSGPFRFLSDEHISGAKAAFARFEQYRPRDNGAQGFTSGPKVAYFGVTATFTRTRHARSS
jgi:peptide/nickel transport system substrate-binding protein